MEALSHALADEATRGWYLVFCFALLILPMVVLTIWFHRGIYKSEGGRALMQRQGRSGPRPRGNLGHVPLLFQEAASMARDIAAGRYGEEAKSMMIRVYWIVGLWLLANSLAFGFFIWADEANRVPN